MSKRYTPPLYQYTSSEEMAQIIGNDSLTQHIDDAMSPDEVIDFYIDQATSIVNSFLLGMFDAYSLSRHILIRSIATYIALYHLTIRLGQPELYLAEYQDAMMQLAEMKEGLRYLDLPTKQGALPVMQNQVIDNRFPMRPGSVVQQTSSKVRSGQRVAYLPAFGWW